MATVNVIATFCKANTGVHASLTLRVNSVVQGTYDMEFDEVNAPVSDEDKRRFVSLMCRIHLIGKTPAQLRTNLISGVSATI